MAQYGYTPPRRNYGRITAPRSPNNRAGSLGIGAAVTPLGLSTRTPAKPAFTQDQVNQSLAANPQASKGGYEGPMPMGSQLPQQAQAPPPTPPGLSYDYSADPILNQISALSSQGRADAQSNALMLKKQLAIDYGDPALANTLGDPNTAQAADSNPFSVRKQLAKSYDTGQHQLDENYNQQNLFYSGARAKGLGDFANEYQGQLYDVAGKQQSALGGIDQNLAMALAAADAQDQQAQQDAADRAIQVALAYGIDPGQSTGPSDPFASPADQPPSPPPADPVANYAAPANASPFTMVGAGTAAGNALAPYIPDALAQALSVQNKKRLMQFG